MEKDVETMTGFGWDWDAYECECGGRAAMGVMSLVAHCDKCPRVYAQVSMSGKGQWFPNIDAANEEYAANNQE
jgi:hypothetical protein